MPSVSLFTLSSIGCLCFGNNTLEERFAEIDEQDVIEKMKKTKMDDQKIPKQLKKAIRKTKLMKNFLNL